MITAGGAISKFSKTGRPPVMGLSPDEQVLLPAGAAGAVRPHEPPNLAAHRPVLPPRQEEAAVRLGGGRL
eukprot:COSAG02_NODE_24712_length_679_cov_2.370690_1_plen_69_part_10